MIFEFFSSVYKENLRAFIAIPFNMWEKTGLKGNIPAKISLADVCFECKLVPKGSGDYLIPVSKAYLDKLVIDKEYKVSLEPLSSLSRINHDSPYSKERPIRTIDSIEFIHVSKGLCGQGCVAMLAGVSIEQALKIMGKGKASFSKIIEALDYYGISHADKPFYTKGKSVQLPDCCLVYNDGCFLLWYNGSYSTKNFVDEEKTVNYLEIYTA